MEPVPPITLLILDDDQWIRQELEDFFLERDGFIVHSAALPTRAMVLLERHRPDIFILDVKLPEMDGLTLLERVKALYPDMEVIMITGHGDMESAIKALRLGASDYLTKPFRLHEIELAVERTGKYLAMVRKVKLMQSAQEMLNRDMEKRMGVQLISASPAMQEVLTSMKKVAASKDTSVLILGESGTGKELVARGIHYLSARRQSMFCAVNTSAVTESLFESEFFGHKKGAYTNAMAHRQGWFETAHNGTLFLDEISEMPPSSQVKLLRVLEERRITRVGEQQSFPVDVRIIAASNQNLEELIQAGKFRTDIYYRLNAFTIHIPPLKERREDVPLLVDHYINLFALKLKKPIPNILSRVSSCLEAYEFPGNVRELKNMVERAMILLDGPTLTPDHFPGLRAAVSPPISIPPLSPPDRPLNAAGTSKLPAPPPEPMASEEKRTPEDRQTGSICDLDETLLQAEKEIILEALNRCNHHKSNAAKALNISRQSLHRRLKKLKLSG